MGEDSRRGGARLSSGLAVILATEDSRVSNQSTHVYSCEDFGHQTAERALEYIFDLPYKSIQYLTKPISDEFVRSILKKKVLKFRDPDLVHGDRDGICILNKSYGPYTVSIDDASICGEIRTFKQPLLVESLSMFSSARANACVWKGKWMYEVVLETSGVQQLGWAAISCSFSDCKGVGHAQDSYAFDGRRVSKLNGEARAYGQSWVVGDIMGCCINLEQDEISFYRNGVSLGVAFDGIRKIEPGFGYCPAISLSQCERCDLNFGRHPFKYPIEGFLPLQAPPTRRSISTYLLRCLSRLLELQCGDKVDSLSVEKLGRLKRFPPLLELFNPISHVICEEFFAALDAEAGSLEYAGWGPFVSFLMEVFRMQAPHDYARLDRVLDLFTDNEKFHLMFHHIINSLSYHCKTAPLVLMDCPYSGSYPYLALACHILRREKLMVLLWKLSDFDFLLEGFFSMKIPNKLDLQCLIPTVWWSGSFDDASQESSMMLTITALSGAITKIEELHRELCRLIIQFVPPITPPHLPGSVFRTFLQNLLLKNRCADHNPPPPGFSSNSVLVSLYNVILHLLSEGFDMDETGGWLKVFGPKFETEKGFLHRGGQQNFPVGLFIKDNPHRTDISRIGGSFNHLLKSYPVDDEDEVIRWKEGCMDDDAITHSTKQKPCCCSNADTDFTRITKDPIRYITKGSRSHCSSIPERSAQVAAECSTSSLNDEIVDKPSSSDQSESEYGYQPVHHLWSVHSSAHLTMATLKEEELLDAMLLLYHIGLAPNFKQASYYMSHQSQSICLLEETDRQIKEKSCSEQLKRLKEARNLYRKELIDCVDCFHALRRSDPPFGPSSVFIKQGLASFVESGFLVYTIQFMLHKKLVEDYKVKVRTGCSGKSVAQSKQTFLKNMELMVTFVVTHFNDPRISSADLRDLLLQSISVLVQYKDYLAAIESNDTAIHRLPSALLSAFDNRSWVPVMNILMRLCRGSGFGMSKHGESSSSVLFQGLLRETCIHDEGLFTAFLNRLFNILSWAMTEFSVSVREMQEKYQVVELHQRKCGVIFDLSCNLARVLEFFTCEIPRAFLSGPDMNLRRLAELIVFIMNHMASTAAIEFFELSIRRQGLSLEKINRGMILAPLVGIVSNLLDASTEFEDGQQNVVSLFASMGCASTMHYGFQYLLEYNWVGSLRPGDSSLVKLKQLENFSSRLKRRTESRDSSKVGFSSALAEDSQCCICYESEADSLFQPCSHRSCFGCITRHLLNCQRCFFCNTTVLDVIMVSKQTL
ncbi:hypothetical protein Syun_003936 [Stephania yunnanensis]|uniref:E3 ubiquitin-protein ligase RKP n=1 Tax=Stephania yunnanensis TaxID=152371 RepID=A0AAP0L619_9MAGN